MANNDQKPPMDGGEHNRIPETNLPGADSLAIDDRPTLPEVPMVDQQPTRPTVEISPDQLPTMGDPVTDLDASIIPDLPTARMPAVDEQQASAVSNAGGGSASEQGVVEIPDLPTAHMPAAPVPVPEDDLPTLAAGNTNHVGNPVSSGDLTEAVNTVEASPTKRPAKSGPLAKKTSLVKSDEQVQTDGQHVDNGQHNGQQANMEVYQAPTEAQPAYVPATVIVPNPMARPGIAPVISVRNVTKAYVLGKKTQVVALRGVSLDVYPGEFVAILGPSGSGKSTFMNMLGCLDRPTTGEYWLAGKMVSRMSSDELAGIRNQLLGFVFQGFNLLGRATALSNVALPMVYAGIPKGERERRARKVLQLVGLGARMHHKPSELSGGQQQRVAIARSLVNGPALLLADEPTGNLDSRTSIEIMGVLQALHAQGLTIVLVTHDLKVAAYATRQVTFLDGAILRDEINPSPRSAIEEWNVLQAGDNASAIAQVGATQVKEELP